MITYKQWKINMLKELLIAGLLGSVASVDTHQAIYFQNNSQYEELSCKVCKEFKLKETHISFVNNTKDTYIYMNEFLNLYKNEVLLPLYDKIFFDHDNIEDSIESGILTKHAVSTRYYRLLNELKQKIKHSIHTSNHNYHKEIDYFSFNITHDGILTFGKMN